MNITDQYKLIFGRKGIADGDVIGMSEHGRAGGVSTGQGFKLISIVGEAVQVAVNSGDSNVTYVGKAAIGAATSGAVWQVKKIDATSGTVITWADTNDDYDNIWDNRESLSYA